MTVFPLAVTERLSEMLFQGSAVVNEFDSRPPSFIVGALILHLSKVR